MTPRLSDDGPPQVVVLRMTPDMHVAIKALAALNDRTMAQEIRRAVRLHLAAVGSEETPDAPNAEGAD